MILMMYTNTTLQCRQVRLAYNVMPGIVKYDFSRYIECLLHIIPSYRPPHYYSVDIIIFIVTKMVIINTIFYKSKGKYIIQETLVI